MFRNCSSLKTIEIPNGITSIPEFCFSGCESLTDIKFPSSLQVINDNSFSYCTNLRVLQIPEGVTKICNDAFFGCSLSEIQLPSTLEIVGGWAFGLGDVKEIILPIALKEIGSCAFDDTQLESVTCLNPSPCECRDDIFKNETYLYATLRVPQESLDLYKNTTPWKNFFKIEGHNMTSIEDIKSNGDNKIVESYTSSSGQIARKPFGGFNIIRYKDGSTKKIIF